MLFTLFTVHPARCLQRSSKTTAANGPLAAASWWMPKDVSLTSNSVVIRVGRTLWLSAQAVELTEDLSVPADSVFAGFQKGTCFKRFNCDSISQKCSRSQQRERTSPQKSRRPSAAAVKFAPPPFLTCIPSALGHGEGQIARAVRCGSRKRKPPAVARVSRSNQRTQRRTRPQ